MDAQKIKIVLADDEEDITELLSYHLRKEGFEVIVAHNGKEALDKVIKHKPQLVLLDVMMPIMTGVETCAAIRANTIISNTPIMLITARAEDYSQIAGLEAGADDYVIKPIKPQLLISRINALLRRTFRAETTPVNDVLSARKMIIDRARYTAVYEGVSHDLPRKEFELLALLVSKPNFVFLREDILTAVWGDEVVVGDRTIDVHIRKLRERFGNDIIKTLKGVGYKYEEL
jgi:two-component system, OmpR family, alkaline phosphatase synthesis response regulator PhoP